MMEASVLDTARHCRHFAMCKIDYLGTGLCPAGAARPFVAYFPQGRMDLVDYLSRGIIPVTEGLLDIADTCDLCGACDVQCYFYTGMRPMPVMRALKSIAEEHRRCGREPLRAPEDGFVRRLRAIVGEPWASNDPAILAAYADDPFPLTGPRMPRAVALPASTDEVAALVRLAAEEDVPWVVRGNGASVYGQVFTDGLVLDTVRMKEIAFDLPNWSVTVGPGVTGFELQRAAADHGVRVNVAEPAATVAGNIICTGLFSTWSAGYGLGADHVLDMEFVGPRGNRFRLADRSAAAGGEGPAALVYDHGGKGVPGVCTRALIRLHPVTGDEEGLLLPFADLVSALEFARELSLRRIGSSIGVLGTHFLATFISPAPGLDDPLKEILEHDLGMPYAVHLIADRFGREAVRSLGGTVIDQELFRTLALGLPRLAGSAALSLVRQAEGKDAPFTLLASPEIRPVLEAVLDPSPETLASAVDEDLRAVYARLYSRPELTDLTWLAEFRIVSARMARHKHPVVFLLFVPMEPAFVDSLCKRFDATASEIGLDHAYGFLTPVDQGRRAVLEYDYYLDASDPEEKARMGRALAELVPWLDGLASGPESNMTWLKSVFTQGSARKEGWFYRDLGGPRATA